jgi:tripartite-type tricarboxylate transporter receptor subunit TctC
MNRRIFSISLLTALCAASAQVTAVHAASYPERPLRFIVPYSPGGTSDFVARRVADALAKELGQQLIVDNRGGALPLRTPTLSHRSAP